MTTLKNRVERLEMEALCLRWFHFSGFLEGLTDEQLQFARSPTLLKRVGIVPCNLSVWHGTVASIFGGDAGERTDPMFRHPPSTLTSFLCADRLLGYRFGFLIKSGTAGVDLW